VSLPPHAFADLVTAIAERRDKEAFTQLFDHFAPRINAYLIKLGADSAMAEEIAQETMATLWRKATLFEPQKSSLSTWLYRIARNRRIDVLRRNRVDFVDPQDAMFDIPVESGVDSDMDRQKREETMRAALNTLPEEQLSLVKLAFFEGLSHTDIATRTGLPLGTVKSRIRLSFSRLRRALETAGVFEAE
jgi:RNA polymerase sigma factor (sigma-70 family)